MVASLLSSPRIATIIAVLLLSCIMTRRSAIAKTTTSTIKKVKKEVKNQNSGSVLKWLTSSYNKKNHHHISSSPVELQRKFPHVTNETIYRFYNGFHSHAEERLNEYLLWKDIHNIQPSTGNDTLDWYRSIDESYNYITEGKLLLRGSRSDPPNHQVMFDYDVTDNDGYPIIQVIPNRMDLVSIEHAHKIYANAMASYIETKFRSSNTNINKITIVLDIRPGRGWANPPMFKMMNTIKQICNIITDLHPERIHKVYVFPIPKMAIPFWNILKSFISKSVTENVVLIPSDRCDRHAPVPKEHFNTYINEQVIDQLEANRLSLFDPPNNKNKNTNNNEEYTSVTKVQ